MYKKNPGVDVIMDILKAVKIEQPTSKFIESLLFQYQERGGLSKKQLEGLWSKASKIESVPAGKLATLEAIILKKVTRERSPATKTEGILPVKDTTAGEIIEAVLQKYPLHKRVLFYKAKLDNKEEFSTVEKLELERFKKLLL